MSFWPHVCGLDIHIFTENDVGRTKMYCKPQEMRDNIFFTHKTGCGCFENGNE